MKLFIHKKSSGTFQMMLALFFMIPASAEVMIANSWVNVTLPSRPAAGYFSLVNNGDRDVLLAAESTSFDKIEIHTHLIENNVMRMRKLNKLDIGADETVVFKPHGLHLMMFSQQRTLNKGDMIELTLTFKNAGRVKASLMVGRPDKETANSMSKNNPHSHLRHKEY